MRSGLTTPHVKFAFCHGFQCSNRLKDGAPVEDLLAYLPACPAVNYARRAVVYDQSSPLAKVFLVISGKVKVFRILERGKKVLIDIYREEDLFGESAFLKTLAPPDIAITLEASKLMSWSCLAIEEMTHREPRLGIALVQMLAARSARLTKRIETWATESVPWRLAVALIHFSEVFGTRPADNWIQMPPFTHELLAQYVGTNREVITGHMIEFRRSGYLRYSRKNIWLYRDHLSEWLKKQHSGSTPITELETRGADSEIGSGGDVSTLG